MRDISKRATCCFHRHGTGRSRYQKTRSTRLFGAWATTRTKSRYTASGRPFRRLPTSSGKWNPDAIERALAHVEGKRAQRHHRSLLHRQVRTLGDHRILHGTILVQRPRRRHPRQGGLVRRDLPVRERAGAGRQADPDRRRRELQHSDAAKGHRSCRYPISRIWRSTRTTTASSNCCRACSAFPRTAPMSRLNTAATATTRTSSTRSTICFRSRGWSPTRISFSTARTSRTSRRRSATRCRSCSASPPTTATNWNPSYARRSGI